MASASVLTPVHPALGQTQPQTGSVEKQRTSLIGPMAWHGDQFANETSFVIELTETDVAEIDAAVATFEGTPMKHMT